MNSMDYALSFLELLEFFSLIVSQLTPKVLDSLNRASRILAKIVIDDVDLFSVRFYLKCVNWCA